MGIQGWAGLLAVWFLGFRLAAWMGPSAGTGCPRSVLWRLFMVTPNYGCYRRDGREKQGKMARFSGAGCGSRRVAGGEGRGDRTDGTDWTYARIGPPGGLWVVAAVAAGVVEAFGEAAFGDELAFEKIVGLVDQADEGVGSGLWRTSFYIGLIELALSVAEWD